MTSALAYEATVAGRFDALERRFKAEVPVDDARLAGIVRALNPGPGMRVLDLGCGKGRFAARLAELGAEVIGLDRSARMLAGGSGPGRVLGSACRLPFADGTFDGVIAVEVFQHLPPAGLAEALDETARVLVPGGTLAVVDRNAGALDPKRPWLPGLAIKWLDERRGRWMYPAGGPVRERWFWPESLRGQLLGRFEGARVEFLMSPDEAGSRWFRRFPRARRMALWAATGPRGGGGRG